MDLPGLLLSMWVLSFCLSSPAIDAEREYALSAVGKEAAPGFSPKMEAQSPEVKIVHHQDLNKRILVALVISSALLVGVLLTLSCCWIYRRKKFKKSNANEQKSPEMRLGMSSTPAMAKLRMAKRKSSVAIFDYNVIEAATNNLAESNIIGEGDCGHVYRAVFDDKMLAAVKRLDAIEQNCEREFENEVNWLSKIQHQNIIKLFGYCIHGDARFLVYEMMENGSLEAQLNGPGHGSALSWHLRMKIAVDVARGLEYLHEHCNPPVIHRDLKSSNILLDSNFNAKLSELGLAVALGTHQKSMKVSGTLGYLAPEYLLDCKLTDKSDVYAFGVVLLELLMGKRPVEKMGPAQSESIVTWATPQLSDRSRLPSIIDPAIKSTMDLKHLYQVAAVAVLCVQPEPSYRPLITDVLHSLIPLLPVELGGSLRVAEPVPQTSADPSD